MSFLNNAEGTASSVDLHTENQCNTGKGDIYPGGTVTVRDFRVIERTALQNI